MRFGCKVAATTSQVRLGLSILMAAGALATGAFAASSPAYTVSFVGRGVEHQVDHQQNIQDSGICDSAEHVDVTGTLSWSTAWSAFRPGAGNPLGGSTRIGGSRAAGSHVKDACGLPLEQAPAGWASSQSCDTALVAAGPPSISVASKNAVGLVLALVAPSFAVPVGTACSLNVRNDQLSAHLAVPSKRLQALKKGHSLVFTVGTSRPGPTDLYGPAIDCSQPTKPYEGYRTADHCQDTLSWSATVTITRAS